ncbi:hypothetical protein Syun_019935 [Stephania yunnanensis]|uniref:Uncharacterized protein n=1 Tax=Stephania yunnanensis TaxID=152371 RepID=A0AAP0NX45_9MAGN
MPTGFTVGDGPKCIPTRYFLRYVQRSRLICVLHKEANLPHHLGCKFQRILWILMGQALLPPYIV